MNSTIGFVNVMLSWNYFLVALLMNFYTMWNQHWKTKKLTWLYCMLVLMTYLMMKAKTLSKSSGKLEAYCANSAGVTRIYISGIVVSNSFVQLFPPTDAFLTLKQRSCIAVIFVLHLNISCCFWIKRATVLIH